MKRSKMLRLINEAIENHEIFQESLEEEILTLIEKAGMLPPKTAPSFHESDLPLEEILNSGLNRWEQEYEEKTPTFG